MTSPLPWTLAYLLPAVVGFLLGSIPFGLLLTRAAGMGDIRNIGSGNIGATNVLRTGNKALAAATLLLDALKGLVPALAFNLMLGPVPAAVAAAGAVLGHMYPPWLGFKGGKGVATKIGIMLGLSWPVGVITCALWLLLAALFRYSSLASLLSILGGAIAAWYLDPWPVALVISVMVPLVWARHHANIRRLLAGTEPKIGQRSTSAA
ncbi:MAG: glycerol-3-phosphate 1-O-acyltransferase PlsY [Reyranella sp.]|uniref:glycerol-3-phosphate 1-O-acyltransferase PlsY n=1 Tax=Reyranella sp. TaxID=1929291 RepID=UPI001AC5DF74|nr:glycerol-3-phosphate 1-O-acyltransferase PlsY [Reyranella sp.]MBN9089255.1 glycerol-3-phosphate 1-O-acyltransferase PlsY [Reyranella sp.]